MDLQILSNYFYNDLQLAPMKKIQLLTCFIIIISMYSCVKDSDVKLPKVEEKLVISCVMSPQDEQIKVRVTLSQAIFNNPNANVSNGSSYINVSKATVVISSDAGGSWTLPYDPMYERYVVDSSDIKVRAGMSYTISVSTLDGKFVKASTSVPYPNTTLTCTTTPNSQQTNGYYLHAAWQDPASTADYYLFEYLNKYGNSSYWNYRTDYIKDSENPGDILKRDWPIQYDMTSNDTVIVSLHTLSSELYNYYYFLRKSSASDGPFSEASPMYTNIDGGFGVFGGFNTYQVRLFP